MLGHGAAEYFSGFAETLRRFEISTSDGRVLPINDGITAIVEMILALKPQDRKAMLIGNGGSAAIVSHLHNDLCKSIGVRALVFNDVPLLTALANDDGYATVFHRPVALWSEVGDLLIAVSSGGESENIVKAAATARERGCRLLTMTGFNARNRLRQLGDVNVYVPASTYGYVETIHSVIAHCVTDLAVLRASAPL